MRIRLVAIDLDNTLLTHEKEILPTVADAVHRARAEGVEIVLASGRIQNSVRRYAEQLGLTGPLICCNGADAVWADGRVIFHDPLAESAVTRVLEFAARVGAQANVYTADEVFMVGETEWAAEYRRRVPHLTPEFRSAESIRGFSVSKVLLIGAADAIPRWRAEIEPTLDANVVRITESEPEYLEFLGAGVSKGTALERVAQLLQIPQAETGAIGDYWNDFEMLAWCGYPGAIGNALDSVKSIAKIVVKSNENGGVADYLNAILSYR
ncbi:MAG: Cof-type HAD-IIB family hydrolase [Fimbriimonadaceae bacterium]|nr:Cof-type HAD-IIB family hydrolase [Fimbriimonadaceae bacterium]